jgi:amino acid adenylation domain-containing protein/non-ribosomal peptide synthase protein (TIGR01720 family)
MSVQIQDLYPLSPLQQGMLFHNLYDSASGMYVERLRYTIRGNLDVAAFEHAWRQVMERHPVLRSAFAWEEVDEPLQIVFQGVPFALDVQDWRGQPPAEQEQRLQGFLDAILHRGFKLTQPPLTRLALIRTAEDAYEFIWSYHHLLLDGWSVSLILGELIALYEALSQNRKPQLEKIRPYRDYIAWLKQQDPAKAEAYWRTALKGFTTPTPIGVGARETGNGQAAGQANGQANGHSNGSQTDYGVSQLHLPRETAERLDAFSRARRVTLNTVVQGAWALLLARYCDAQDVVFGAVASGRPAELAGSDSMVGMFINTLPVRVGVRSGEFVLPWLERLQAQQIEARRYEYNPLVKVREWSEAPRGAALFESIMVFENPAMSVRLGQQEGSPEITYSIHHATVTGYPLTVVVEPGPAGVGIGITYDRRRFDADTIRRMQAHLRSLLEGILADPEARIANLPLMSDAERRELVEQWNETRTAYPLDQCLHHLFEAQAARTPDAVALVYESETLSEEESHRREPPNLEDGSSLTYRQLNARANQLAAVLRARGVGPESRVGLCLERGFDLMAALLGVLKAGAAYVPLDPAYPRRRLAFMLADCQADVVLTTQRLADDLGIAEWSEQAEPEAAAHKSPCAIVCLETIGEELNAQSDANVASAISSDHTAYVIYTSGSTGKPKGVMISHRAIGNHMHWLRDHFDLGAGDIFFQKTAFSFDAAGTEFYGPLLFGGRLILAQAGGQQDGAYLARTIIEHGVTILQLVPSLLRVLLEEPEFANCRSLRRVICAGEALPAELQARFAACPVSAGAQLHNFYGPTEAAIDVTYWPHAHAANRTIVPIGRPLANTQIYLLDSELKPVPVGVAGELHVGGENLARGYLNRPDLTAEKFIPNPFAARHQDAGGRLYKTGDLACYLPTGDIEYLGRIDNQVKVRGFRIELGEIETAINQHAGVRESVVVAQDDGHGNKRLVAYVVPASSEKGEGPSNSELRDFVKAKLPDYMVPSALVRLEELPLTPNGKVDRRALPAPRESAGERPDLAESFVAPRTPVEQQLARVWSEVLGVKQIGIHDNFFELGGDSILSIQVVGRLSQQGIRITPRQLFQHPTIEAIAELATAATIQAEQGIVTGPAPLGPVQHWFFEQNLTDPQHWNHAILLTVAERLDPARLEAAMQSLLAHHDALRMRFVQTGSGWEQFNAGVGQEALVSHDDLSALSAEDQRRSIEARSVAMQTSLDLHSGPLVRVVLFDLGPDTPGRLLILIHHLVVDGVAWRILLEDLMTAYRQLSQGQDVQLPAKTTSFQHWTRRLAEYAQSAALRDELPFWLAPARAEAAPLPLDNPENRAQNTEAEARTVSISLTNEETRALLTEAQGAYRTEINDLLLTALLESVSRWSGGRTLLLDLEGHGRESLFDDVDLSRTAGWFTSIFPVLLERAPERGHPLRDAVKSVKEQLRAIPRRGVGYGLLRYLSGDAAALAALPRAELSFNYLGQFDQVLHESSPFGPAPESVGPPHGPRNARRYLLEVNAFISGGRLQLDWAYSETIHHRDTIERLAADYAATLRALIAHCLSPEAAREGGYTPSDFPLARLEQTKLDGLTGADREIEDIYPLSPVQEGMLFYTLLAKDSGAYVTQAIYELEGLNVAAMKRAWQQVLDRHPILRTGFVWKNLEHPLQIVRRRVALPLAEEDWRGLGEAERATRMDRFLTEDQQRGFDLSDAPPMRMRLFQLGDASYKLVWSYHHLLLDGWSAPVLIREFLGAYESLAAGGQPAALERSRPYRDYIEWIGQQDLSQAEAFWRRYLKGFHAPTPYPGSARGGGAGYVEQDAWLNEVTTAALVFFARKLKLTLNTLVQGAWALLLAHDAGTDDVVFGATLSGRPVGLPGAERMVGLFINTLPIRVRMQPEQTLVAWLNTLQDEQSDMRQYEGSPLNEVGRWSELPRDKQLFESIVVFENFPVEGAASYQSQGLRFANTDFVIRNNFPLTVRVVPGAKLLLKVLYDASRYDAAAIDRVQARLETLLRTIVTQPDAKLSELLGLIAEADRQDQSKQQEAFKETRRQSLKGVRRKASQLQAGDEDADAWLGGAD